MNILRPNYHPLKPDPYPWNWKSNIEKRGMKGVEHGVKIFKMYFST